MADAVRLPAPAPIETGERSGDPTAGAPAADPGGWALMLVPASICLVMFIVAAMW